MKVFKSIKDWQEEKKQSLGQLGLVPTMGALHQGHLSLVKESLKDNESTLVSIFVNPTQFNNPQDLDGYPQQINEDLELLEEMGTDYVLLPTFQEIYPDNYRYKMTENSFSQKLCGKYRPGHFDGVLTIVLKLLNLSGCTNAYFGKKDYQQYLLIKEMAESLFLPVNIIGCETVREESGLAMSSRNLNLSLEGRQKAALFYEILKKKISTQEAKEELSQNNFEVDYIEDIYDRRFGAVTINNVRLIDNVEA